MTGVQALVRFLKENPGSHDADDLARRFVLDRALVQTAIAQLRRDHRPSAPTNEGLTLLQRLVGFWMKITAKPLMWLIVFNAIGFLSMLTVQVVPSETFTKLGIPRIVGAIMVLLPLFLGPVVQILGVMRHGSMKDVFRGVGIYASTMVVLALTDDPTGRLALLLATFVMSVMYLVFAAPAVLACAYLRVRKERREIESMSRQQLLERLFEVRKALEDPSSETPRTSFFELPAVLWCERYKFALAFLASLIVSASMSLSLLSMDPTRKLLMIGRAGPQDIQSSAVPLIVSFVLTLVGNLSQFCFGALSRRPLSAMLLSLTQLASNTLAMTLPFAYIRFEDFRSLSPQRYLLGYAMVFLLTFAGYFFRQVVEHHTRNRMRKSNDPEALMAELLELEWRLTPQSSRVTVLAVDVAGSTRMKQGKDPLIAEWSFRAYQAWVERTCARFGGIVHSTAGDGAIVGFTEPKSAMEAAKALLAELAEFNRETNRLETAFQLRIGIHQGDVQGDLGDVQFTRVIDVAAHLEAMAPIGSFAVSETVIDELPTDEFTLSAATSDGHQVYAWSGA